MKQLRFTLLGLLIVGVGAWLVIQQLGDPPAPPAGRAPLVPQELVTSWDEIDLDLLSEQNLRLVREPGVVTIRFGSDPNGAKRKYSDAVDEERLIALLQALRDSAREPLAGTSEDLLRAGLDPPRYRVTLRRKEGGASGLPPVEIALGFGNDDPTGTGVLARSYSDGTVFRTSRQVPNLLELNLRDWRSKTVFGVDPLGVNQIDRIHNPPDGGEPDLLTVVREGPRSWRIASPRSLMADPQACYGLAQAASLLRINTFVAMEFDANTVRATGLPDNPDWSLQISSDSRQGALELLVGDNLEGQGYACVMPASRGPSNVFTIAKEQLDPILERAVDSLRPKRLYPHLETSLVLVECRDASGAPLWRVAREARHRNGKWRIETPFEDAAHVGLGSGSFGQVVVELDRVEVNAFLPPEAPFQKEGSIVLEWPNPAAGHALVLMRKELELQRDPSGKRTLVQETSQPGELFAVTPKLGALLELDPQLYRDRRIFPPEQEFTEKVRGWKLERPGHDAREAVRSADGTVVPGPASTTPAALVSRLTSAAAALFGQPCAGFVRASDVSADGGDRFATTLLELTLETYEGPAQTLTVSGAPDSVQSPDGIYCKLRPRLPDDVWMIVPRALLQPLIDLP